MDGFVEPHPDVVQPAPVGADDPLGESVLDPDQPWCRVFLPRDVRVVIGRNQDPHREADVDACRVAGVPLHRRVTGGGTVVLAPGMVVVALRLRPGGTDPTAWFAVVGAAIAGVIGRSTPVAPVVQRLGDLTLPGPDAAPRKILGASLRQNARLTAYLGVLLVDDAAPLMERFLRQPSREPAYRAGRGHRAFCDHLSRWGLGAADLARELATGLPSALGPDAGR
jgi:lipoate---protein ligase